jgi:rhamnosyltransferase
MSVSFAVCVPTLNAGSQWVDWLTRTQVALQGAALLVVDSSSDDDTAELARRAGAEVLVIPRAEFDHGTTRDMALRHLAGHEVVIFLTQDALVEDAETLQTLARAFEDPRVGAAFGRQLPQGGASAIAAHGRDFNYPGLPRTVDKTDVPRLGIKAAFLSNAFTGYRRDALIAAGGFPHEVILAEDMLAGARLLQEGWALAYCPDARVRHSHDYSLGEEFRRYFDIGVLHARERWLLEWLGKAEGEGLRFVRSEAAFLVRNAPMRLPEAGLRTLLKYLGYRLGRAESRLPGTTKRRLSMHPHYWPR